MYLIAKKINFLEKISPCDGNRSFRGIRTLVERLWK